MNSIKNELKTKVIVKHNELSTLKNILNQQLKQNNEIKQIEQEFFETSQKFNQKLENEIKEIKNQLQVEPKNEKNEIKMIEKLNEEINKPDNVNFYNEIVNKSRNEEKSIEKVKEKHEPKKIIQKNEVHTQERKEIFDSVDLKANTSFNNNNAIDVKDKEVLTNKREFRTRPRVEIKNKSIVEEKSTPNAKISNIRRSRLNKDAESSFNDLTRSVISIKNEDLKETVFLFENKNDNNTKDSEENLRKDDKSSNIKRDPSIHELAKSIQELPKEEENTSNTIIEHNKSTNNIKLTMNEKFKVFTSLIKIIEDYSKTVKPGQNIYTAKSINLITSSLETNELFNNIRQNNITKPNTSTINEHIALLKYIPLSNDQQNFNLEGINIKDINDNLIEQLMNENIFDFYVNELNFLDKLNQSF